MTDQELPPMPMWGHETDPENLELALSLVERLIPAVVQMHRADADRLGLDPSELSVIEVLGVVAPLSIAAIAGRCALSHAATARAVHRLATRGWVDRFPDPHDRRGWLVERTDTAIAKLADARSGLRHDLARLGAELGEERRLSLLHLLVQVTDRVAGSARAQTERRWRETQYRRWLERNRMHE